AAAWRPLPGSAWPSGTWSRPPARTARGRRAAPSTSAASPNGPGSRPATSTWSSPPTTCSCSSWSCGPCQIGEDCAGQKGGAFHQRCFAERAREQARDVDVVVTNHHLLLLELELRALSDAPGGMLPEVDVVVVDEAHRLADSAADLYGVTVTGPRLGRAGAAADAAAKAAGMPTDWSRRLRGPHEERGPDPPP